ncbi:MAG: InlB B-repeat-containing protein, partial [Clostridia bacterium]|nr:InlB B-repeat-containing protein [Clostridia bacterium]
MKTKSRNLIVVFLMVFAFVCGVFAITPLTANAAERADRDIVAVNSGNELNMCITDDGMLNWDTVDGATGYKVYLKKGSYTVATFDSMSTSMFIASAIDQTKADSGQYLLEVAAVGASKSASMQYYYTSNVDKLEAPTKLQWLGNNAVWEYVDDAEVLSYTLYLYNFNGLEDTIINATSPCDLSEYNPQDGWTFQVQAKGDRKLSSKRSSILVESPAKGSRTKTLTEIVSSNSLNMAVSSNGMLTWDSVSGATGYKIILKQNGYNVGSFETTNTYFILDTEMNSLKFNSGSYVIELGAKGVSKNATMNYFYTSHVDQLEAPNGLKWLGYKAIWNEVEGATSYTVSLFNFSGLVTTVNVDGVLYDFEGNLPQDGWTFKVQANGDGTFNSKRNSEFTESPALVAPTCNIGVIIVDSTNTVHDQGGQVYLQTNKATQDWTGSGGFSRKATYGSTVTLKAQPNVGYEFLGWRLDGDWASGEAEYQFTADVDRTYYAMFQKVDYYFVMQPTDHTVAKGNAINVNWSTNIIPSKTEIQYWDETAQAWDQWDVNNAPASKQDDYDFQNDQAESIRFRLVAYTGETPIANSDEFTITWVEPNIDVAEAFITEPVGGESPDYTIVSEDDRYTVEITRWREDFGNKNKLTSSDTYITGKDYGLELTFTPKTGYEFTNATVFKINGKVIDMKWGAGIGMRYTWYRAKAPVVVEYGVNYAPGEGQGSGNLDYVNAGTTITLKTPQELGFSAVEGKMFDAWKINEVRYEPGDEYLVNSDIIITALWKNVPVTATALSATYNGGNILAGTKINPSGIVITMTYSNSTQTPIDAGSVEYWYNGTQIQDPINYVFGVELIGTRTITVKYLGLETTFDVKVVGYEITFNANTGSGTMESVEYVGAYTLPTCQFTAPNGKQFKGWALASDGEVINGTYNVTADVELFAIWEDIPVVKFDVTFNANGGTGTMQGVEFAGTYTLPTCEFTAPDGKKFKGWSTSANGEVINGTTYNVTADVELYAIWEDIPVVNYTITFNANGGTGTMQAVEYVGEYTLPTCTFTAPDGKQFKGWALASDGEVIDGTYNVTANVELYAIWENIPAHEHNHGTAWESDANNHWNECSCGDKANVGAHSDGNADGKCDTC